MHAHFQYELSKDEYISGLTALTNELGRQDTSRTRRLIEQLAVFVGVLAIITVLYPDAVLGVLVAAVLLSVATAMLQRRWLSGATGQSYDVAVAEHDVLITDDGISSKSALRQREWSWSAVRRIHDCSQAIVLEFVGWDMLVLPNRVWASSDQRRGFLSIVQGLATNTVPPATPSKPASIGTRDLLALGAIGAAVDVLALVVFSVPSAKASIGDAAFLGVFAAVLLLGFVLAYVAFRFARRQLESLYDSAPAAAISIAQVLIWAVPLYMLIAYFGWT
jgi:hypothetical protein